MESYEAEGTRITFTMTLEGSDSTPNQCHAEPSNIPFGHSVKTGSQHTIPSVMTALCFTSHTTVSPELNMDLNIDQLQMSELLGE